MRTRVLLIDDDPHIRELVTVVLEEEGYEVHTAPSGVVGLSMADAEPPDVALLDLEMPGMNGYEVCRILRHGPRTRRIPVVLMTASDDPALNREAYAAGADACVPKPFRREGLVAVIETALAQARRTNGKAGSEI